MNSKKILLIDTLVFKYDFNFLENNPLGGTQSNILYLLKHSHENQFHVLNNNTYKSSKTQVKNNILFIKLAKSINEIKTQIKDLFDTYNYDHIISINYPQLIDKLLSDTKYDNQNHLNSHINTSNKLLYATLCPSQKMYHGVNLKSYNKIIGVSNYQINKFIETFPDIPKNTYYLIKNSYNPNIDCNSSNLLFTDDAILLKQMQFYETNNFVSNIINEKEVIDLNKFEFVNKINVNFDLLDKKKIENNTINIIYNVDPLRGLDVVIEIFIKLWKQNPTIKYKLILISSSKLYGKKDHQITNDLYDKLREFVKMDELEDMIEIINPLSQKLLNYKLYQANIFVYPANSEESSCISLIENLVCGNICIFYDIGALKETACGYGFGVTNVDEMISTIKLISESYVKNFNMWLNFIKCQIMFVSYYHCYARNSKLFNNYLNAKHATIPLIYESYFNSNNLTLGKLTNYENIIINNMRECACVNENLLIILYDILTKINKSCINYDTFINNLAFILETYGATKLISIIDKTIVPRGKYCDPKNVHSKLLHNFESMEDRIIYDVTKSYDYENNRDLFNKFFDKNKDDLEFKMNKLLYEYSMMEKNYDNDFNIKNIKNNILKIFKDNTQNYLIFNFVAKYYTNNNLINMLKLVCNKVKFSGYSKSIKISLIKILHFEIFKENPNPDLIIKNIINLGNNINENTHHIYKKQKQNQNNYQTFLSDVINENFDISDLSLNPFVHYNTNEHYEINTCLSKFYISMYPDLNYKSKNIHTKENNKINITFVCNNCYKHSSGKLLLGLLKHLPKDKFNTSLVGVFHKFDETSQEYFDSIDTIYPVEYNINSLTLIGKFREKIEMSKPDILFYSDIGNDDLIYYIAHGRYANVQMVHGWGNPITTGIQNIDYFINMKNRNCRDKYSEEIIYMNNLSSILEPIKYDNYDVAFLKKYKSDYQNFNIYLCGQSLFKYNQEYLKKGILPILENDPKSLIIFINTLSNAHKGFTDDFNIMLNNIFVSKYKERILLLPKLTHVDYCSLLKFSNVVLDSYPYGGGITSFETICMDNAMVYMNDTNLKGRLTHTLFNTMHVTNGSCKNYKTFVEKAIKYATNKEEKQIFVDNIRNNKHLLFNHSEIINEYVTLFNDLTISK